MKARVEQLYTISFFSIITVISLFLSILALFSSKYNPQSSSILQLISLISPLLLIINCLLFTASLLFFGRSVVIPAIALIINITYLSYISPIALFNFFRDNEGGNRLKVVSYNVNYFSHNEQYNVTGVASLTRSLGTEILTLQEFSSSNYYNVEEIAGLFDHFGYKAIHNNEEDGIGMALFSRYPIISHYKKRFDNSGNGYMVADLLYNGDTIRVINCHLQTTGFYSTARGGVTNIIKGFAQNFRKRARQAQEVREVIEATVYPLLVMGDFNETPGGYTYDQLIGNKLNDSFKAQFMGFGGSYRWSLNLLRIDYILHSKHFRAKKHKIEQVKYSDHKPVIVELEYKN